jgi:HSP20 family protein
MTTMTLMKYCAPVGDAYPVDRLASEIFGPNITRLFGSDGFSTANPKVNIVERAEDYRIEMEVPGFDKKDLKVEMVEDSLTIRGEHSEAEGLKDQRYTRREFSRRSFERSFVLPHTANGEAIQADHVNGVLLLTIPKTKASTPKLRQIDIK